MRLFIGTTIHPQIVEQVENLAQEQLVDPAWRVAPSRHWHVTALFIGERPSGDEKAIKSHVKRIAKGTPRIMLRNGRLGAMPRKDPRMLWVKFSPEGMLTSLHLTLATALDAEPSKHLPYTPHITLARARATPPDVSPVLVLDELVLDHLTLFSTELHPQGSIHHPLATWTLK